MRSRSGDHPRSRGVYTGMPAAAARVLGSSPLARGLRLSPSTQMPVSGIIPARAGFTPSWSASFRPDRDHPRSRGVYSPSPETCPDRAGSSPLARGLRWPLSWALSGGRIIPARAGFTHRHDPGAAQPQDHPRSRGVYSVPPSLSPLRLGSSPLARGLPCGKENQRSSSRIIPARAGFTSLVFLSPRWWADHPRSRGVYLLLGLILPVLGGIIPARAGFTSARSPRASLSSDHPRSRGVYESSQKGDYRVYGSSPLARGLP